MEQSIPDEQIVKAAEGYGNNPLIENIWAEMAYTHSEIYMSLISSAEPRLLKLTKYDDELFDTFNIKFPGLNLSKISEEDLKSPVNKVNWREFCERFKFMDDFDFATLLRLDSSEGYNPDNTILVARTQFLAIEIARNRTGCNNSIWENSLYHKTFNDIEEKLNLDS